MAASSSVHDSIAVPPSFLLKVADDAVQIFQSLIAILSSFYAENMSRREGPSLTSPSVTMMMSGLELVLNELHQNLAVLWPCEKRYVAVIGRTGCGKSTLLNLLLSLTCATGEKYVEGINVESARAVLRDTARLHCGNSKLLEIIDVLEEEETKEDFRIQEESKAPSERGTDEEFISDQLKEFEKQSFRSLLGICCAQDRQAYMSRHLPNYDAHPFLLRNGRMGDAGTTKVTAIEYGPKYVGHLRWMTRKKMRKKLRDLRQLLDKEDNAENDRNLAELKEFWTIVRQLVGLEGCTDKPTEEQIHKAVDILGSKKRLLDREEVIEVEWTKEYLLSTEKHLRCMVDRVYVKESIKKNMSQQYGKLIEDLRIEVPVSSFEGGVSLLDVPGTNDPRVLHQRETRDAIDRTSLILLVLDKSVIDVQTEESLAESLLLERMLMDETARCRLVVVGIAEKDCRKGQSAKELINGFDPKGNIIKNLRKIFMRIAARLWRNRRIGKVDVINRVDNLFANSISLIPVLPFLCASIYLSAFNPEHHQVFCESRDQIHCPILMSRDDLMSSCIETNIPELLEKIQSVRVPPNLNELCHFIKSTVESLKLLTQQSKLGLSYIEFLKTENEYAASVDAESVTIDTIPDDHLTISHIENMLDNCGDECRLLPDDIQVIVDNVTPELLSQLQSGSFALGPFILRGFRPEIIGRKANELIQSIDKQSQEFIKQAIEVLKMVIKGDDARIEGAVEKVEPEYLPMVVTLYQQVEEKWSLSLQRLRARCFCGGMDGGLLGKTREVLKKAYYGGLKHLSKRLKQKKSQSWKETVRRILEADELRAFVIDSAKTVMRQTIQSFWIKLLKVTNLEMQFLWRSWQVEIKTLSQSASDSFDVQKRAQEVNADTGEVKLTAIKDKLISKIHALEVLRENLESPREGHTSCEYGYSLLQADSYSFSHTLCLDNNDFVPDASTCKSGEECNIRVSVDEGNFIVSDENVPKEKNLGSGTGGFRAVIPTRAGSIKKRRPAQMLSEEEALQLQKRESKSNKSNR